MVRVPTLEKKVATLEEELRETKQTLGSAVLTLVKRVKSLEVALKKKTKKMVISKFENEETEAQGRNIKEMDCDPLVSLVKDFVTPTKTPVSASGEEQTEEISPNTLEAAKTFLKVASQAKTIDKGKRYKRRKGKQAQEVNVGLDFDQEVSTGFKDFNAGDAKVSTGSIPEQLRQEGAGLEEAIKLQAQLDEEVAKQIHLDEMAAQFYTGEDWDAIKAKLEANAELTKDVLGKDLGEEDFAKRM
ncbi:hypothetical protein Tco_1358804, partial [Tanacetum coccineum]